LGREHLGQRRFSTGHKLNDRENTRGIIEYRKTMSNSIGKLKAGQAASSLLFF